MFLNARRELTLWNGKLWRILSSNEKTPGTNVWYVDHRGRRANRCPPPRSRRSREEKEAEPKEEKLEGEQWNLLIRYARASLQARARNGALEIRLIVPLTQERSLSIHRGILFIAYREIVVVEREREKGEELRIKFQRIKNSVRHISTRERDGR